MMWIEVDLTEPLTFGKLRELVNNEFSKFSDSTAINVCLDLYNENVKGRADHPKSKILSIVGDEDEINFYNYI